MKTKALLAVGTGLWMMATAAPAAAQQSDDAQAQDGSGGISDIVVTAQRRSEKLQDVPITITALSGEDLQRTGVASVQDLGTLVSGFTSGGSGTVAQPAIRGVSSTINSGVSGSSNATYVDGIYQVSQTSLTMKLPDIERVEVLKGPQGTLFGRNATGGAIQIFTRNPSFTPQMSLNMEAGAYTGAGSSRSASHFKVDAFATAPLVDDLLAFSVSAGVDRTAGYLTNDKYGERTGLIRDLSARGKLLFTPASNFEMLLSAYYMAKHDEAGNAFFPINGLSAAAGRPGSVLPTEPWHVAYRVHDNIGLVRQWGGSLRMSLDLDAGTLTSLTGYTKSRNESPRGEISGGACQPQFESTFQCLVTHFAVWTTERSQEINFASRDFGPVRFVTGLYYYHGNGGITNELWLNDDVAIPAALPTFATKSYAAYGEVTVTPIENFSITAGLRYNYERQRDVLLGGFFPPEVLNVPYRNNKGVVTSRLIAKYDINPDLNIYASYSEGFKAGLTGAANPSGPVRPERLKAYEAGIKFGNEKISANGSFFYYDYSDLQVFGFEGTQSSISNAASARIYGVDADMTVALTKSLRFRGGLSWLPKAEYRNFTSASYATPLRNPVTGLFYQSIDPGNPRPDLYSPDVSGTRLVRAPRLSTSATLSYDDMVGSGRFDASTTLTYSSKFDHDLSRTVRQKGYASLSAQLGYRPGDGNLRIGLYARNLTNRKIFQSSLTSAYGLLGIYAPPQEVGMTLGVTF